MVGAGGSDREPGEAGQPVGRPPDPAPTWNAGATSSAVCRTRARGAPYRQVCDGFARHCVDVAPARSPWIWRGSRSLLA